jgi:UDP-GlcNAc:undecaprenyl-phosphate GlcNAc-1-phosphate transferase
MHFEGFDTLTWHGFVVSLGATVLAMWALFPFAHRLGLVDHPVGRKDHAQSTPATGGVAMYLGLLIAALATLPLSAAMGSLLVAGALLVGTGWLDELHDLRWYWRILIQVAAALILIYGGGVRIEQIGPVFGAGAASLGALSVPLTVIATVGLINALNMIDGIDGLAGTLMLAALVMVLAAAGYSGNDGLAERATVLIGAVVGFLLFNFRFPGRRRAHAFMGNSGSALLGLVVAWSCFRLTQNEGHPVSPVFALWLAPVPVIDCLTLIVRRLRAGRSPFSADHDHVHHIMRDAGFSPLSTALGLAVFTGLCGLAVGQCLRWNVPEPLLLAAYGVVLVLWFALTANRARAVAFFRVARFWARWRRSADQPSADEARNEA